MAGVRDIELKAEIEAAMDERRTGEGGYRRRLTEVRQQVPAHPGRPIEPFGYIHSEAKYLLKRDGGQPAGHREALGNAVRRFTNTAGRTSIRPSRESIPRWMSLRNSAERLDTEDLGLLIGALMAEQRRRARKSGRGGRP